MKKLVSMGLIILILVTNVVAFANIGEKLEGHWSKDYIEKEFVAYYFPYLAKESFDRLNPNETMDVMDFILSLASLSKDYDLDATTDSLGIYHSLTRRDVVDLVGKKLISIDIKKYENKELPFKDINTMDDNSIELLRLLYSLGIINGTSKISFTPDRKITQAEAIIILQRLKGVLEEMRRISFNITGIVQGYNNQEEVIVKEEEDTVLVTITKEFPTPGYGMDVEKIVREADGYKIDLQITPPKEGSMQLQVITYKTMTIEIQKRDLIKAQPYVFIVEEVKSNLFK